MHLLLVLRLVCTVVFVIDEVEPGVSVSENSSRAGWTGTNMGKASVNNKGKCVFLEVGQTASRNLS